MQPIHNSGYELCYLGTRQSVSVSPVIDIERSRPAWFVWGRSAFAVLVVLLLAGLGVANIAMHGRWHEVEDGVLWGARAEGVVALEVAPGSAAAAAGVERGDVLLAVNGAPIESPSDVIEFQHQSRQGTRLSYT